MSLQTPDWVKRAVFYQIFPDRFARSPHTPPPLGIEFKPWGTPPEEQGFQGGDLLGIVEKLDYLQDLGITALYLNPIFTSASNHRYHTYDYYQVDPLLGGNAAFRELLDQAHARDIRIVLDGVFNHASRGFWAFHHILETGGNSPYLDWFIVRDWPLRPYDNPDNLPTNYDCWWGNPALPQFNIKNPGVRAYLLDVAKYWIDFGVDGWRLDVPEEIKDEAFWQAFRQTVKQSNPDAYLVGEIWHVAHEWLRGDRFDAVMNYIFSRAALGFFGAETLRIDYKPGGFPLAPLNAHAFGMTIDQMMGLYDWQVTLAQMNVIDTHDTARMLWMVGNDESALRLCTLFQMTMPGAPCVYYGDEIGLTGGHDPGCRGPFPWDKPATWNTDLLDLYRRAIAMRHRYAVFSLGSFQALHAEQNVYAFRRDLEQQAAVVVFNAGRQAVVLDIPGFKAPEEGRTFTDVWHSGQAVVQNGKLNGIRIAARDAVVLVAN